MHQPVLVRSEDWPEADRLVFVARADYDYSVEEMEQAARELAFCEAEGTA